VGYEGVGREKAVVMGDDTGVCVRNAMKAATTERRGRRHYSKDGGSLW